MQSEPFLAIKDACGRQINLLNDVSQDSDSIKSKSNKRRYHCNESGCSKSFTTSGHLARHHRIHTGEKNFRCLYPGCLSRFSRQDNMMQHFRTHTSPRSRRPSQSSRRGPVVHTSSAYLDSQPTIELPELRSISSRYSSSYGYTTPSPPSMILPPPPLSMATSGSYDSLSHSRSHRASSVSSSSSSSASSFLCSPTQSHSFPPGISLSLSKGVETKLQQLSHIMSTFG